MDQTACEVTIPFSDQVSRPILTKSSHLSNKSKDNCILDAQCQIRWNCLLEALCQPLRTLLENINMNE